MLDVLLVAIGCVAHYLLARKLDERKQKAKARANSTGVVIASVQRQVMEPVPSMES